MLRICAIGMIAAIVALTPGELGAQTKKGGNGPRGTGGKDLSSSCEAAHGRCIANCKKVYPPGRDVLRPKGGTPWDSRERCMTRCDVKYIGHCS